MCNISSTEQMPVMSGTLSTLIGLKADQGGVNKGQSSLERGVIVFVPDVSASVLQSQWPFFVAAGL